MITAITPAKIGRVMKKREKRMGISSVEGRSVRARPVILTKVRTQGYSAGRLELWVLTFVRMTELVG